MGSNIKYTFKDRHGTTMIEVLVALVVVLFITMVFSRVVASSVRMLSMSTETISETEKFNEEYYKTANYNSRGIKAGNLKLVVDKDTTQDITAHEETVNLNNECKMVFWMDNDNGYSMYAVDPKGYGSVTPPTSPSADPVHTTEPDAPSPTPASTPTATPTSDPASGTGDYIELLEGENEKIYEYNDWDTVITDELNQAKAEGRQNFAHKMNEGHVYILVNEEGEKEAYVCIWPDWDLTIDVGDTKESIIKKHPEAFVKFTEDTRVFTYDDIRQYHENNGNVKTFSLNPDERPKKGDLFWDGLKYYLARQDIGEYDTDFTKDHWMYLLQPASGE